jgi:hypothetical protein
MTIEFETVSKLNKFKIRCASKVPDLLLKTTPYLKLQNILTTDLWYRVPTYIRHTIFQSNQIVEGSKKNEM